MFRKRKLIIGFVVSIFLIAGFSQKITAQTTDFTYQGKLTQNNSPANGEYDFEFRLYDALTGGNQIGTSQSVPAVIVTDGIFTVRLDFGAQFPGANRWLQILVRPRGTLPFTLLSPRQPITSSPYAVRSLQAANADNATSANNATTANNALNLGGVAANQYVVTTDSRLSNARNPLPGSANYIQNTTSQQASTNFNISGNGTLGGTLSANTINSINTISGSTVNATTQFNLGFNGGQRVLSVAGSGNLFAGIDSGATNSTGHSNSFFGERAGNKNTIGYDNSFFGNNAGLNNLDGTNNAFFGNRAGEFNSSGEMNSFFGYQAGGHNNLGNRNTFVGFGAGFPNTSGNNNTAVGYNAGTGLTLTNATAIGAYAQVDQSNSLVLGGISGVNSAPASTNVGIGTTTPKSKLHVAGGNIFIAQPNSLIITSPNGACWFVTVNNSGGLSTISTPCP